MNRADKKSLADRGLLTQNSAGSDAVRVYLQYVPDVPGESREARGEVLRTKFEQAREHTQGDIELHPDSMSVSGQMIEALLPVEQYEQAARELEAHDMRVDIAEAFDATL